MMGRAELNRLLEDARQDPHLLEELRALLSDPEEALRWACGKGYMLLLTDIAELRDSDRELSDDDLEQAAGGDNWPPP
jgi:predicted ribosomally synthesized peptide with nif11-like leader